MLVHLPELTAMTDSTRPQAAPCGTWTSPISAAVVAAGAMPLSQLALDGQDVSAGELCLAAQELFARKQTEDLDP